MFQTFISRHNSNFFSDKLKTYRASLGQPLRDRKSGSAGMPRPISYAVFCLKKKKNTQSLTLERVAVRSGSATLSYTTQRCRHSATSFVKEFTQRDVHTCVY